MPQRETRQRHLVLDAVRARCDHPSADEIYLDVREKDSRISRGTVYRNLNVLAENQEITHVKVPSADRYDPRLDRHYHLFCVSCGAVCDAPLTYREEYDRQVEETSGFRIQRHRMIFEGLCAECQVRAEMEQEDESIQKDPKYWDNQAIEKKRKN